MEIKIEKGIDDTINSKVQIFHEKTRNGLVLFEKDKFPKILGSGYDPVILNIINCSFLIKDNLTGFFQLIEPFVEFNLTKSIFEIEDSKSGEFKRALSGTKALAGIDLLEISPADAKTEHIDFLNKAGASTSRMIAKEDGNILNLQNFSLKTNKKFDITFSNHLLHDNAGIEDETHSNAYRAMEIYTIMSNLTKKNGYSIHCHGAYISSLYETYFQFLGFKVVDYFRVESGHYNFGIIMKKMNDKEITLGEFDYLYAEMRKRNPIRYR
ncbi:hypothetical protein HYV80_02280 [Candidatus Woesearchaeota archaeon]|nr:hypothetical protein [Candidatus Woesearchaeota archaeon]